MARRFSGVWLLPAIIGWLFSNPMFSETDSDNVDTPESRSELKFPPSVTSKITVGVSAVSDRGKVRPTNEDHYLVVSFGRYLRTLLTNLPEGSIARQFDEVGHGMIVADGMGGLSGGDVASRLALNTMISLVLHTPDWILRMGRNEAEEVMLRMEERFRRINAVILEEAAIDSSLAGMGTTMTMAASLGKDLFIGHVGDSRAYLLHQGALHKLTNDHTVAQQLIDAEVISTGDACTIKYRRILTQALGIREAKLQPEVQRIVLDDGDQVLLCTDGLTDMLSDAEIATVLLAQSSATKACLALVGLALERGAEDNVTVVNARYSIPQ